MSHVKLWHIRRQQVPHGRVHNSRHSLPFIDCTGNKGMSSEMSPERSFPLVAQKQGLDLSKGCRLGCWVLRVLCARLQQLPAWHAGASQAVRQGCLCKQSFLRTLWHTAAADHACMIGLRWAGRAHRGLTSTPHPVCMHAILRVKGLRESSSSCPPQPDHATKI